MSAERYEATRPWERQGMSRAEFESHIRNLPDAWVREFRKWLLPDAEGPAPAAGSDDPT
jgi:hypothetical protein